MSDKIQILLNTDNMIDEKATSYNQYENKKKIIKFIKIKFLRFLKWEYDTKKLGSFSLTRRKVHTPEKNSIYTNRNFTETNANTATLLMHPGAC